MYRYAETIGNLTRTYEAETTQGVVDLVMAVTIDIQNAISAKQAVNVQLTNVDLPKLQEEVISKAVRKMGAKQDISHSL